VLAEAGAAGDQVVAAALDAPEGGDGCYWEVVSATPGGPVIPYLGLLHGSAGIALALAHLGRVSGEERFLVTARRATELLLAQATSSATSFPGEEANEEESSSWLTWPRHLGDKAAGLQAHCHGAGGIAQFFLCLDRLAPDPRYPKAAEIAARTVATQSGAETRSGICHGLSGTGHLMVDCYQAFGDPEWLVFARESGRRLQQFRVPERPGVYAMHGEHAVSPDLMLGYAGVGSLLLRLVDPTDAPDLILGPLHDSLMKGEAHVR
jgi:lantibiotic modifying enzyme